MDFDLRLGNKVKSMKLDILNGGHMMVNIKKVGDWMFEETIYYLKKEYVIKFNAV